MNSTHCVVYENDVIFSVLMGWTWGLLLGGCVGLILWWLLVGIKFYRNRLCVVCGYLYVCVVAMISGEIWFRLGGCDGGNDVVYVVLGVVFGLSACFGGFPILILVAYVCFAMFWIVGLFCVELILFLVRLMMCFRMSDADIRECKCRRRGRMDDEVVEMEGVEGVERVEGMEIEGDEMENRDKIIVCSQYMECVGWSMMIVSPIGVMCGRIVAILIMN